MNKAYKTVWNASLGAYVAVAEDVPAAGRHTSSSRRTRRARPDIFVRPLSTAMALEERVVFDGAGTPPPRERLNQFTITAVPARAGAVGGDAAYQLADAVCSALSSGYAFRR